MATYTLAAIAEHIGGELHGDPQGIISGAAEIDKARQGQITFLANPKYKDFLEHCKASAVIIDAKAGAQPAQDYILVPDAYFGFLQAFLLLNPQEPLLSPGIHPAAIVEESAVVGENVAIGANVYIGKNARVGNNTQILPNTVIMDRAEIGSDCLLH
nr:LpxD N-terminal domain-containing protein [Calditrichia bacterium]